MTQALLIYVTSHLVTAVQRRHQLPENNHWVFNVNTLLETLMLLYAAHVFFTGKLFRITIRIIAGLFLAVSAFLMSGSGFLQFSVPVFNIASLMVVVLFTTIMFLCVAQKRGIRSEIWASTGLVFYFACNLPYFSAFNFLNENHLGMSETLYRYVTLSLQHARYLLLGAGFYYGARSYALSASEI